MSKNRASGSAAVRQRVVERSPLDELHRHERHAVLFFDREDGDDVGMVERGHGAGFTPESRQALRIGGDLGRQHLERDIAAEPRIVRAIDVAHPAGTEGRQDLVGADALTLREVHGERRILLCGSRQH